MFRRFSLLRKVFGSSKRVEYRSECVSKLKIMDGVKALTNLGYMFNEEGQLRKIDKDGKTTEEPFQFNISDKHEECQAHYEELGSAVTYYVYHLLETQLKLKKLPVPMNEPDGTFIFVSENYDKKDVLLILIHGSGVVRAGQWARSLIINDNLDMGSQIPYIKKALSNDYGVMLLNTNDVCTPDGKAIRHSSTAEEHALYVWKNYVANTSASSIAIVAHSYGGVVTVSLAEDVKKDFEKRVKAIALTDSVHGYSNKKVTKFLKEVSRNWISSKSPLDSPMKTPDFDITRVSAGQVADKLTARLEFNSYRRLWVFAMPVASRTRCCPVRVQELGSLMPEHDTKLPWYLRPILVAIKTGLVPYHVAMGHERHEMTSYSCIESVFKYIEQKIPK